MTEITTEYLEKLSKWALEQILVPNCNVTSKMIYVTGQWLIDNNYKGHLDEPIDPKKNYYFLHNEDQEFIFEDARCPVDTL